MSWTCEDVMVWGVGSVAGWARGWGTICKIVTVGELGYTQSLSCQRDLMAAVASGVLWGYKVWFECYFCIWAKCPVALPFVKIVGHNFAAHLITWRLNVSYLGQV